MSQPRLQRIPIHILLNISQSKDNQTMKFCQIIEYNKKSIFLQTVYRILGENESKWFALISPPYFGKDFSRKMFLILHSIN